MPGSAIALIVAGIVAIELVVVFGLVIPALVRSGWGALASRFPAVPPEPDAVRREFQSFSVGVLNLGWCVHVAVDAAHLHLEPSLVARRWGCRAMSIPWSEVRPAGKGIMGFRKVTVGMTTLSGPAWCLGLAAGGPGGTGG